MSVRGRLLAIAGLVVTALGAAILTEAVDRRSYAHEVKQRWDSRQQRNAQEHVPFELLLQ